MGSRCDVLLINPPHHRRQGSGVIFPLGLGYLKACLDSKGYNVIIIDCSTSIKSLDYNSLTHLNNDLRKKIQKINPKYAIGIGPCTTSAIKAIQVIADACIFCFPSLPIIYGGPLASIKGQDWLFFEKFHASFVVPGDGEYIFSKIIDEISINKQSINIEGVITYQGQNVPINIISDLDKLPFPWRPTGKWTDKYKPSARRDLFQYPVAHIVTSRGCPFSCNFCLSGALRKGYYVRRSWQSIGQEVDYIVTNNRVKSLIFYDDSLFPSPTNLYRDIYDMTNAIQRNLGKFVWQCEMHPKIFQALTGKLINRLYTYGCRQINLGIEGTNSKVHQEFGKEIDTESIRAQCDVLLNEVPNLRLTATFILGGSQETVQSARETVAYAGSLPLLFAHFYPLKVYPGTELYHFYFGLSNPRGWYEKIMSDTLPWGEVIYCEPEQQKEVFEMISWAYSYFYNRQEWRILAKKYLDNNYDEIAKQVSIWAKDRFSFSGS
jgi:anaerobic magnesium-protoporphyrin IX monomethyl ester cyclase